MKKEELKKIIQEKVFDNKEIKVISANSELTGNIAKWIFNFKKVSLDQNFLKTLALFFQENFKETKIQVGGMESGSLPILTSFSLSCPSVLNAFYIRKSRKKHDLSNSYEGEIKPNLPIILIDDILNTGATFLKQISILESYGYKVAGIFVIVRYRDSAQYREILEKGIKIESVFELNDFKESLGVENINTLKIKKPSFDTFSNKWAIKLAEQKSNMYIVVPKSGICDDEHHIYTGADDGSFYCINKNDGSVVWKYRITFGVPGKNIFSTPTLSEDFVFFGAYDGNLYCLNKIDGSIKWIFFDADYVGSSPWVESNKYVYLGLEFGFIRKKGGIAKIYIDTGKIVWGNYEMYGLTHASPVSNIKLNVVVCGCNDQYVYCFDRINGDLIWKYKTRGEVKYGVVFDEKRKLVIAASMDGGVYCINVNTGTLWHKFEAYFGFYSTALLESDMIYIGSLDKRVYCFSLKDREKKWEVITAGRIFASPTLHMNSIFIGSNDGNLYEINKLSGAILSRTIIPERIVNRVLVSIENSKRVLYVKSFTNELFKFIEKLEPS